MAQGVITSKNIKSPPEVNCGDNETSFGSGNVGITTYDIALDVGGGLLVIDFSAGNIPDKLEIEHDGAMVATTGMPGITNSGSYDPIYNAGMLPTEAQANNSDWFIGNFKGAFFTRETEFLNDTGLIHTPEVTGSLSPKQIIWFKYTATQALEGPATLIVTAPISATAWGFNRWCPQYKALNVLFSTVGYQEACSSVDIRTIYIQVENDFENTNLIWSNLNGTGQPEEGYYYSENEGIIRNWESLLFIGTTENCI